MWAWVSHCVCVCVWCNKLVYAAGKGCAGSGVCLSALWSLLPEARLLKCVTRRPLTPVPHLGPSGASVLSSVTHSRDGLSTPPPSSSSSSSSSSSPPALVMPQWAVVFVHLDLLPPPLQQTLAQPRNAACLQSCLVRFGCRVAPEQDSFQWISHIFVSVSRFNKSHLCRSAKVHRRFI